MRHSHPGQFENAHVDIGRTKTKKRARAKIKSDYGNDHTRITDLTRGRIIVETHEEAKILTEHIEKHGITQNAQKHGSKSPTEGNIPVLKSKNRFSVPSETNFRDLLTTVKLKNGHVAELRIEQSDMVEAGKLTHEPYEKVQKIERAAKTQARIYTKAEAIQRRQLLDKIRDTHQAAADKARLDLLLNEEGKSKLARFEQERKPQHPTTESHRATTKPAASDSAAGSPPHQSDTTPHRRANPGTKSNSPTHTRTTSETKPPALTPPTGHSSAEVKPTTITKPGALRNLDGRLGNTVGKAGTVLGVVQTAIAIRQGDYVAAAQQGTMTVLGAAAQNQTVMKGAGKLLAKSVPSLIRAGGEEIPVVGAIVASGFALWDIGSSIYGAATGKNSWSKVGTTVVANAAEIGGGLVGFGAGQVARQGVVEISKKALGEENAPSDAALFSLGKEIYGAASSAMNGTTQTPPTRQAQARLQNTHNGTASINPTTQSTVRPATTTTKPAPVQHPAAAHQAPDKHLPASTTVHHRAETRTEAHHPPQTPPKNHKHRSDIPFRALKSAGRLPANHAANAHHETPPPHHHAGATSTKHNADKAQKTNTPSPLHIDIRPFIGNLH